MGGNVGKQPILLVSIATAISLIGDSMLYVVLPIYWEQAGLHSLWEVGILLSINRFVRLPLNPLIGWLYSRITLRTGLLLALAVAALTTLGYAAASGFAMWFALRVLWGAAWSFIRMGGYFTVIEHSENRNRGHHMGRYNGISRLGSLFGMLLGGVLASALGLQAVSLIFGLLGAAGFLFLLIRMPTDKTKPGTDKVKSGLREAAAHLRTGSVLALLVSGLTVSMLFAGLHATLGLVIARNYGDAVLLPGLVVLEAAAFSGVLLAMRYSWDFAMSGWFGRKSDQAASRRAPTIVALAVCGIAYGLMPWHVPVYIWIAIVMLAMAASTALNTFLDATASDTAKSTSTVAVMTAYAVSTDLGAALGPAVSLWIIGLTGALDSVYIGMAAIFLAIAAMIGTRGRRADRMKP